MGRRERRGKGFPRWVIVPNVLGFGGTTRMDVPSIPRFGLATKRQRRATLRAAIAASVICVLMIGGIGTIIWLVTRLV